MYAHTIAIAKSLLADGHTEEVRQMLRPLIEKDANGVSRSESLENNRMMLRALLAQAILIDDSPQEEAFTYLQQDAGPALSRPRTPAEATLKLWRGWALSSSDDKYQNLPEAIYLLGEASKCFATHARTDYLHWTALGLAKAYINMGEPEPANHHLQHANQILAVLKDSLAASWSIKLQSCLSTLSPDHAERLELTVLPLHVVAHSKGMRDLLDATATASVSTCPVLISGERGAGKSRIARLIHRQTGHAATCFYTINCDPSSSNLPIDQVFADHLEQGDEMRTIYLHHIEQLPRPAQEGIRDYLIGLLESKQGQSKKSPVRIMASASANLAKLVLERSFDKILYQSLQLISLQLEPLRNRRSDIPLLARHFVHQLRPAGIPFAAITEDAIEALVAYNWPGNVRQLRNEIERALVHVGQEPFPVIGIEDLSSPIQSLPDPVRKSAVFPSRTRGRYQLNQILSTTECSIIKQALADHKGQVAAAADALGLTRQGLYKKMKRLGISASSTSQSKAPPHVASTLERY